MHLRELPPPARVSIAPHFHIDRLHRIAVLKGAIGNQLEEAFQVRDKLQRRDAIAAIKADVLASLKSEAEQKNWQMADLAKEFAELEYRTLRDSVYFVCPATRG